MLAYQELYLVNQLFE